MAIKRGHRLRDIDRFPSNLADQLEHISVSTAEEFISQTLVDTKPIQDYLGVASREFERLVDVAESVIDGRTLERIRHFRPKERSFGARSPYRDEFDRYRPARGSKG